MRGAVIGAFYQPPLIRPASSSSNCPKRFQAETGAGRSRRRAMGDPSALQRETKLPKRRLIPPGAVPIAAAARRAPAPIRTADPGPPPWATRARSATGNFFNRGVIRARRRNGRRPGKSERTSRPKRAERHQRQHCLSHRIPPLLRRSDDSRLAARQKEADRLPHAEKPRDFGLSTLPPPGLALTLQACKLDSIDQGIRGD